MVGHSGSTTPSELSDEEIDEVFAMGHQAIMTCNNDEIGLRMAAERSRLPFDRPTEHELGMFPELWESRSAVQVFLYIRNTALRLWLTNPLEELGISELRAELYSPFNSDVKLIENVHHYLTRNGIINVGRFRRETGVPRTLKPEQRSVIIIGAGVAGISAALQLISFGFDVTIIEARERIGGRVSSITNDGEIMEIGADTIRSSRTNPMTVLVQQLDIEPYAVREKAPIYEPGPARTAVESQRDKLICGLYTGMSEALEYLSHAKEQRTDDGLFVSRQRGFENLMNQLERETVVGYYNYWKIYLDLVKKRDHHFSEMKALHEISIISERRLDNMPEDEDPLLRRSLKRDFNEAVAKYERELEMFEKAEINISNYKKHPARSCSKQYMHPHDYRNFNFYLGHEELVFGAPLECVQLSCDAAKNKLPGCSVRLAGGIAGMLEKLVERRNIDFRLGHRVLDIDYSDPEGNVSVKVQRKKENSDEVEEDVLSARYCVCTVPLGVLKKTVVKDARALTFTPPLPQNKETAIKRMGYGLVNKIVLLFEKPFWESTDKCYFGQVGNSLKSRGEMFLWQTIPGTRVMTTYLAGYSADVTLPDDVVVNKAMMILSTVFPQNCPRVPVEAHITRYQDDEFSFGAVSYMSLQTEAEDYDHLMEPLKAGGAEDDEPKDDEVETEDVVDADRMNKNTVYFAGEHTSKHYAGSLQGAWLSGIRVAAQMANEVYGLNYADFGDDVEFLKENNEETTEEPTKARENGSSKHSNGNGFQEPVEMKLRNSSSPSVTSPANSVVENDIMMAD